VEIVKECAPVRIVVEDHVSKPDHLTAQVRADGELIRPRRRRETKRPYLSSLRNNVTIEVRVQVGTSIVSPPTVSMEDCNGTSIMLRRLSVPYQQRGIRLVA
jgi:hypothetical protein